MAEPIKFKIKGSAPDTDAPTVEDFLDQVRDVLAVLRGVEIAIDERGEAAIEWRITNAAMNSPISLEATPYARNHAVDISARADLVRRYTADGMRSLQTRAERPDYFSTPVIGRVQKVAQRVMNGLAATDVDFGGDIGEVTFTPPVADATARHTDAILKPPKGRPYKEIGTLEGYYQTLGADEHGHAVLQIKSRRTGDEVRCGITGEALEQIRARLIGEVLDHRRLRVRGVIHYKQRGRIDRIVVDTIQFMPSAAELPSLEEIVDPTYTGGLSSTEYLDALRNGRPS